VCWDSFWAGSSVGDLLHALTEWDRAAFLWLNRHTAHPVLDRLMPLATDLGLGYVQAALAVAAAVWMGVRLQEAGRRTALAAAAVAGGLGMGIGLAITERSPWAALLFAAALALEWAAGGVRGVVPLLRARAGWLWPLLLALALSGLAATALKQIPRERPWWFYERQRAQGRLLDARVRTVPGVYPLKVRGFPSGHTATTVALATVFTGLALRSRRRLRVAAGLWALAAVVAFSRIYLASHWPLDVIGGALLGVACGLVALRLARADLARAAGGASGRAHAGDGG